jgi:hypothetical protein
MTELEELYKERERIINLLKQQQEKNKDRNKDSLLT